MMRPTPKAVLLFSSSVPFALLAVSLWREAWYVSLYPPFAVAAFMALDAMMALPAGRVRFELRCPARLFVGQRGRVDVGLVAEKRDDGPVVEGLLEQSGEADPPHPASGAWAGERLELQFAVVPRRRGRLAVEALWLRWRGPFGLVEVRNRYPVDESIDVLPDVKGIHQTALQFFSDDAVYGVKTQRLKGEGTEFESLCDYAQGMDNRLIDWKRSARHRRMLCREFHQERNHRIVLGFDTGHLMLEPIEGVPRLDHAIKAGLLLSWISLYSGDLVGGCGFDVGFRSFLKPGRGMPYFTKFQRFSAGLAYSSEETNFTLALAELNSRLQRRALVVLFTEFVDQISAELLIESLRWILRRHVVVFVTMRDPMLTGLQSAPPQDFESAARAVVADDFLRERAIVLERIARLGVHCIDASVQKISGALIGRYLMVKQRGLL